MTAAAIPAIPAALKIGHNFGWTAVAQGWTVVLSLGSGMVLARLLTPSDYGVLAAVAPLIGTAHQLQSLGFSPAIIHARHIDKRQLDALFWTSFGLSVVLAGALVAAAPVTARLFGDPRLEAVLMVASLSVMAMALVTQPTALLARQMRFRAIALRNVFSVTAATIASIAVAAATHSYWALVIGPVMVPLLNLVTTATLANWLPGLPRRGANARGLLKFGMSVWAANVLTFVSRNADNLIVAYAATPRDLGIYDRAYRVLLYPINQAVQPLGQVMISSLSHTREEPERYRAVYWRTVALLLMACQPGIALAVVYPRTVIGLLLGPAWLDGAAIFSWFGIAGLFQIFLATTNWLLISQGRGGTLVRIGVVTSLVALASFAIGISWGITGVAIAYVVGQAACCLPYTLWETGRTSLVDHRNLALQLMPHAAALALTLGGLIAAREMFGLPRWPLLITATLGAYLGYVAVLLCIGRSRALLLELLRAGSHAVAVPRPLES